MAAVDFYTVGEAARILKVGDHRVRQMLREDDLEGKRDPSTGRWRIPQHALHALLEERPERQRPGPATRGPEGGLGAPLAASDLLAVVRDLEHRLGRSEARAELTEKAESTIREERDRLLEERDRERERAERLEEERVRLREQLEAAQRPWWRRMFGG